MVGYEELCWNSGGLLFNFKHLSAIDSELALRGKGEKYFGRGAKENSKLRVHKKPEFANGRECVPRRTNW